MVNPGDVVMVDFPGVTGIKRRPAVVVSTEAYHRTRPDAILGLLTSQVAAATGPTDCVLQDWQTAGLRTPSAFRTFLATMPTTSLTTIGCLSDRDWQKVQGCLRVALAIG
ncbi:MAG: type II toxin-antitoxin system PemK/MazF family toxin [Chloroflexi bacterium]|nr:type II toxin-antitoxin system PemK/MazF family toxin [Chloroflexota bacterium]